MRSYWQFMQSRSKYHCHGSHEPLHVQEGMLSLRSCFVDARRMLLFGTKQIFLLMGEVWLLHNSDMWCIVEGREGAKSREELLFFFKFLLFFDFFLSCYKIRILFHYSHGVEKMARFRSHTGSETGRSQEAGDEVEDLSLISWVDGRS